MPKRQLVTGCVAILVSLFAPGGMVKAPSQSTGCPAGAPTLNANAKWEFGSLQFTNLQYGSLSESILEKSALGTRQRFCLQAANGDFAYNGPDGPLLTGKISSLRVQGARWSETGNQPNGEITIGLNGLSFSLTATTLPPIDRLFGGEMVLPKNTGMTIHNVAEITETYTAQNKVLTSTGDLQATVGRSFPWKNAVLSINGCTGTTELDFSSDPLRLAAFVLSRSSGQLKLLTGRFKASPQFAETSYHAVCPGRFEALMKTVNVGSIIADIDHDNAKVQAVQMTTKGAYAANVGDLTMSAATSPGVSVPDPVARTDAQASPPVPSIPQPSSLTAFGSGLMRATTIEAIAPRDAGAARLSSVRLAGLTYCPAERCGTTSPNIPAAELRDKLSAGASGFTSIDVFSPALLQEKAIDESLGVLSTIANPNIYVQIAGPGIKKLINSQLARATFAKSFDLAFANQEILLIAKGVGPAAFSTDLLFHVIPAFGDRYVSLRSAFSVSIPRAFALPQALTLDALATKFRAPINTSLPILTGSDSEIRFPVPTNFIQSIDLSRTYTDPSTGINGSVSAQPFKVSVSVPKSVILIDESGLHVMAQLEVK